jgi:catechol 2,3-dioxygenase
MSFFAEPAAASATAESIAAGTSLGAVSLTVSDLAGSRAFYERALGLRATELDDGGLMLGGPESQPLVELHGDASAPPLDRRATGLFHLAILLPSRRHLAQALVRLAQARWPLDGASDHLVSEALYLSDPDGNGIEIYRDRPRSEWRYEDGTLQMSTLPLDLHDLLGELDLAGAEPGTLPPVPAAVPGATTIGHVHLQVSEIPEAEAFYAGVLGFDVVVRGYPGALFVSAGGYHHHIGLNTWHSAGRGAPAPGAVGLRRFEVVLPSAAELERVVARVDGAGLPVVPEPAGGLVVRDPSGNGVLLRAA